ncbi:MAG: GntR family transcriptional regulator [Trebonia sp.]
MRQSERAYIALRDEIVSSVLAPGEALPEAATAARLNVSRSPVREATRRLASENLVTIVPGRGAFVATVSLTDAVELYQLREALEPMACRLAAGHPDEARLTETLAAMRDAHELIASGQTTAYHELCSHMDNAIVEMCGNARLATLLTEVWQQAARTRGIADSNSRRLRDSVSEHEQLLRAIIERDASLAESLCRAHIRRSMQNVFSSIQVLGSPLLDH